MGNKVKVIFRRFLFGMIALGLMLLIASLGVLFVYGGNAFDVLGDVGGFFSGEDEDILKDNEDPNSGDGRAGAGGGSGGGGSGGGTGTGEEDSACSYWGPIQYSLGEFEENIECLIYGVEGCEKVKATCTAELRNLNDNVGGVFGIRFSLFSGGFPVISEIVEENLGPRERVVMRGEMMLEGDVYDVSSLECVTESEFIPVKCFD
jgi:hypothetical protein